jgi:hypothetical protein
MNAQTNHNREARNILQANDQGRYTIPTHGLYPYQWNWDSAFAAMGFATFDIDRAWTEIETLFTGQWDNGMVPHILFHQDVEGYFPGADVWGGIGPIPSSGITQPPVALTFARKIYELDPDQGRDHILSLYPKMRAWVQWFLDWRLDQGAVCVTQPWESGRDNAPCWDVAMNLIDPQGVGEYTRRDTAHVDSSMRPTKWDYDRYIWLVQLGNRLRWDEAALIKESPFRVADPTMTFILLRAVRDLKATGDMLDLDVSGLDEAIQTLESGAGKLWNADLGCFDSREVTTGAWSNAVTNASFLCWYAGMDRPEMRTQLDKVLSEVRYGVPSLAFSDDRFDGKRYWRGPTWAIMNMMIGMGLSEHGLAQGEQVRQVTADMIRNNGFAEYFDPRDGAPAGGQSFTWTAAVWLAWANQN